MFKKISEFLINAGTVFFPAEEKVVKNDMDDYYKLVEQARQEWHGARQRFEQISDPDLIDHAIYAIESTERRYMYLLKKAREARARMAE